MDNILQRAELLELVRIWEIVNILHLIVIVTNLGRIPQSRRHLKI